MAELPPLSVSLDLAPARGLGIDLEQYLGLWCIEPQRGFALYDRAARLDLAAHVAAHAERNVSAVPVAHFDAVTGRPVAAAVDGRRATENPVVAVIDIAGSMTKHGSSLSGSGSTVRARQEIRRAANDPNVDAILLRIDSPGGTVAGTADLGAEIAAAAERKPLTAFVEDLAASAAYWAASQARRIVANDGTALVGSIGTLIAFYDLSGLAGQEGIKPVVISTGGMKGLGFPGSEVTDAQKAHLQQLVDRTQAGFTAAVARGRQLSAEQVTQLADGRVHVAQAAQDLGLIDAIQSFDATLRELADEAAASSKSRRQSGTNPARRSETPMAESTATATPLIHGEPLLRLNAGPATLAEIKAICPKAEPNWLLAQLEKNATLDQAGQSYRENLEAQLAIRDEELKAEKEKTAAAAAVAAKKPGVAPLAQGKGTAASAAADPVAAFDEAVAAKVKSGLPKSKAVAAVIKADPELHAAYVAAANDRG